MVLPNLTNSVFTGHFVIENLILHQHAGCHGNGITISNDVCLIALPVLHDTCKVDYGQIAKSIFFGY